MVNLHIAKPQAHLQGFLVHRCPGSSGTTLVIIKITFSISVHCHIELVFLSPHSKRPHISLMTSHSRIMSLHLSRGQMSEIMIWSPLSMLLWSSMGILFPSCSSCRHSLVCGNLISLSIALATRSDSFVSSRVYAIPLCFTHTQILTDFRS